MQDNVHNSVVAIKKAREEGVIINVKTFAAGVANSLSIPLHRDFTKTIFSGDDYSPENSYAGIPDTFDLSLALRNAVADRNPFTGCAHRIISSRLEHSRNKTHSSANVFTCYRLFWKDAPVAQDALKWMTVNCVKNSDVGADTVDSSDSATASLIYSLREHQTHTISLRLDAHGVTSEDESRLYNALDKFAAPSSNDCLYAKRIYYTGKELNNYTELESNDDHAVVALYFSVSRLSLSGKDATRSTRDIPPTIPIGVASGKSTDYLQLLPAVLEVHVHVSVSSHLFRSVGWRKILLDPVPQNGFIAIYANQMDDEVFKTLVNLKEAVSSEYCSIVYATQTQCLIEKQEQSMNSAINAVDVLSSCLQELHAEGGKLSPTMRRIESVLCSIDSGFDSVKVYVSVACRAGDTGLYPASQAERSPASPTKGFTQKSNNSSPYKHTSPTRYCDLSFIVSQIDLTMHECVFYRSSVNRQEFVSDMSILYETPGALVSMRFGAIGEMLTRCNFSYFDFECYEVVGRLTFEFEGDSDFFMRKHRVLLLAFAKALGRRCYEFYRGSRSKKQLVQEIQKVSSLEVELKNMRYESPKNNLSHSLISCCKQICTKSERR